MVVILSRTKQFGTESQPTAPSTSLGGSMCVISAEFPQVVLRADWDGGQLILFGQNELHGATLSLSDSGGFLQLFDQQGHPRASLPDDAYEP